MSSEARKGCGPLPLTPSHHFPIKGQPLGQTCATFLYLILFDHFLSYSTTQYDTNFGSKASLLAYKNKQLLLDIDPSQAWQRGFLDNLRLFGTEGIYQLLHSILKSRLKKYPEFSNFLLQQKSMNVIVCKCKDIPLRRCHIAKIRHISRRLACQK